MAPLARWAAALANVGSSRVHVVGLGDSITEGTAASSTDSQSFTALARAALQAAYGGSGIGLYPMKAQIVSRYTSTGGGFSGGTQGPGSFSRKFSTSASNYITATVSGDTLLIGYNRTANTGDFVYTVDGGSPVTVTVASGAVASLLHTASLGSGGSHTIVVKGSDVAGKETDLWGIGACTGSAGIQYHQFGVSGEVAGAFTGTDALKFLTPLAPALVVCCLDTNDYALQTSLATYEANLISIITASQAAGADVLFIGAPNRNTSLAIPRSSYIAKITALCVTYDCTFVDLAADWGTAAQQEAIGLVSAGDHVHPTTLGHLVMANNLVPAITSALPGTFLTGYGINFRDTAAYVTDAATQYHDAFDSTADVYPIYKGGNRTGWGTKGDVAVNVGNRSSGVDPRLAGIAYVAHGSAGTKQYKMEVTPGTYNIRLAGGDAVGATDFYCQILDGATVLATISNSGVGSGQFIDATGVIHASAAAWISNNTALSVSVAGSVLTFDFGNPGGTRTGNNKVAHIGLLKPSTPIRTWMFG